MKNPHKHHIIPDYRCKELGMAPGYKVDGVEFYFKENMVRVEQIDHARIHWGYWCDDLEPLFEYITPAQWIIDLIPRADSRDFNAFNLINGWKQYNLPSNKPTKIFNRVFNELSRFPYTTFCYACCPKSALNCSSDQWRTTESCVCTMPLWDDDYVEELDHENKIRETKRRIANGYEGLKSGEKLQAYCLDVPRKRYESLESMHRDSGSLSSLNEFKRMLKRIVRKPRGI